MPDQISRAKESRLGWKPLTYTVEFGEGPRTVELPFVVAVIADLSGTRGQDFPRRLGDRNFVHLEVDNLNHVLEGNKPGIHLRVPNLLNELDGATELSVELSFRSLDDFTPGHVARQVAPLAKLIERRVRFGSLAVRLEVRPEIAGNIKAWFQDPRSAAALRKFAASASDREASEEGLDTVEVPPSFREYLSIDSILELADVWRFDSEELPAVAARIVAEADRLLSRQLDAILHHPDFRRLEATWRGLSYLARQTETGTLLKLRVLNAKKDEIRKEFEKSAEFDQSALFRKLHEEESSVFGGEPYGLIMCDFEVAHDPPDLYLLRGLARLAAACRAPALLGAAPALFQMDTWETLHVPRDLSKIFQAVDYRNWNKFRDEEDSTFITLVLPRLLAREPWDSSENTAEHGFSYVESTASHEDYLWMNGAFGLAAVITNAFARDRWCIDMRGPHRGRVDGLPTHFVVENDEIITVVGPTEKDISDRRQFELERLGFTSILRHRRGEYAAVLTPTALGRPTANSHPEAQANQNLARQLEHQFVVGRIRQAIIAYLRDHAGLFRDLETLVDQMQAWLGQFTVQTSSASGEPDASGEDTLLLAPFRSVSVRIGKGESDRGPIIETELKLNYVPAGETISRVLLLHTPPGLLSSRLVP